MPTKGFKAGDVVVPDRNIIGGIYGNLIANKKYTILEVRTNGLKVQDEGPCETWRCSFVFKHAAGPYIKTNGERILS